MDTLRKFEYKVLPSYPHLTQGEAEIWTRFVAAKPDEFDFVFYDVPCGDTRPNQEELKLEWELNRQYLGKYKIDVVGVKEDVFTIIEIKKEATTKALGEVWLYEYLFKKDYEPKGKVKTMILSNVEMPNVREVCSPDDVAYIII